MEKDKCKYGCGQEALFELKNGAKCCCKFSGQCPEVRRKNSEKAKIRIAISNNLGKFCEIGHSAWNKGLTKETDERVSENSRLIKQHYKDGKKGYFNGKCHSNETKKKLSIFGGIKQGAGRGKKGWYKGYWCSSSWELAFIIYNLEHDIKFERNSLGFEYEFDGKRHKYYPDFIMEDKTYIEVKGYKSAKWNAKKDSFVGSLKIIDKDGIRLYIDYVESKYGKDFYRLYEDNPPIGKPG